MKPSKILLTVLTTLAFTATLNADLSKSCKKAEKSFWGTMEETYNSADHTFMGTLDEQVQVSYFKMALEKIEGSVAEVRKECKGVASKEILDAYNKKKSKIASQMYAL